MNSPFADAFRGAGWVVETPPIFDVPDNSPNDVSRETITIASYGPDPYHFPFQIGERLICDMSVYMRFKRDGRQHSRRPVYVYAYLSNGEQATHILVMVPTTQIKKRGDKPGLIFDRPDKFTAVAANKPFQFKTRRLFCVPIDDAMVLDTDRTGHIAPQYWLDILLKRADALFFNPYAGILGLPKKRDGLTYHGPVFEGIDIIRTRSKTASPDMAGVDLGLNVQPKIWDDLGQVDINRIAAWARHRRMRNLKYPWPGRWDKWPEYSRS